MQLVAKDRRVVSPFLHYHRFLDHLDRLRSDQYFFDSTARRIALSIEGGFYRFLDKYDYNIYHINGDRDEYGCALHSGVGCIWPRTKAQNRSGGRCK
jgi:hypothetical protein